MTCGFDLFTQTKFGAILSLRIYLLKKPPIWLKISPEDGLIPKSRSFEASSLFHELAVFKIFQKLALIIKCAIIVDFIIFPLYLMDGMPSISYCGYANAI